MISATLPSSLPGALVEGAWYSGRGCICCSIPGRSWCCSRNGGFSCCWVTAMVVPFQKVSARVPHLRAVHLQGNLHAGAGMRPAWLLPREVRHGAALYFLEIGFYPVGGSVAAITPREVPTATHTSSVNRAAISPPPPCPTRWPRRAGVARTVRGAHLPRLPAGVLRPGRLVGQRLDADGRSGLAGLPARAAPRSGPDRARALGAGLPLRPRRRRWSRTATTVASSWGCERGDLYSLILGLLTISGLVAVWHVVIIALMGTAFSFEMPSRNSLISHIVGPKEYLRQRGRAQLGRLQYGPGRRPRAGGGADHPDRRGQRLPAQQRRRLPHRHRRRAPAAPHAPGHQRLRLALEYRRRPALRRRMRSCWRSSRWPR